MENNSKDILIPEPVLEICQKEERGHFKIFIGYAPGVGKTYSILSEGNRRIKYGEDVVIGYIDCRGRVGTQDQLGELEIIPRKKMIFNKVEEEEMDTNAIIARKPHTVLIDELAHTNVPGSKNKKRYMDIEELLCQGINVVSTMNIQHMESLNDVVKHIMGIKVSDTVPDHVVDNADEVVVVDLTPEGLQNRLKRGAIYDLEKVPHDLENFFKKGNLTALRELALRQIADEVDDDLSEYLNTEGVKDNWALAERLMICISPSPTSKKLIRRGSRIAKRYRCDWFVVSVHRTSRFKNKVSLRDKQMLYAHHKLAQELGAQIVELEGKSVSQCLAAFANEKHITQIMIGNSQRTTLETLLRGSTITKLLKLANNIEIHVIPNEV